MAALKSIGLFIGYRLSAVGGRLSAVGGRLSAVGGRRSAVGGRQERFLLTENRKLTTDYLAKSGMRFGELPATQPLRLRALSVFRAIFVAVCFSDRLLSIDETHCSNVFLTCFSFFCVLRSVVVDELRRTFRLVGIGFSLRILTDN